MLLKLISTPNLKYVQLASGSVDHRWDGVFMVFKEGDKVNGRFLGPNGDTLSINNCMRDGCNVLIRT